MSCLPDGDYTIVVRVFDEYKVHLAPKFLKPKRLSVLSCKTVNFIPELTLQET